jgi:hypothetical protein
MYHKARIIAAKTLREYLVSELDDLTINSGENVQATPCVSVQGISWQPFNERGNVLVSVRTTIITSLADTSEEEHGDIVSSIGDILYQDDIASVLTSSQETIKVIWLKPQGGEIEIDDEKQIRLESLDAELHIIWN